MAPSQIQYTNEEAYRALMNRTFEGEANTMVLEELPDGTFALLDYDWAKIAETTPDGHIRLFAGWSDWAKSRYSQERPHDGGEPTTARHVRELAEFLFEEGRNFEVRETRPQVGTPPQSLRELGHLDMLSGYRTDEGRTE